MENEKDSSEGNWILFILVSFIICFLGLNGAGGGGTCGHETIEEVKIRQIKVSQFNEALRTEAFYIAMKEDEAECMTVIFDKIHYQDAKAELELKKDIEQISAESKRMIALEQALKYALDSEASEYKCLKSPTSMFQYYVSDTNHKRRQDKNYINSIVAKLKKERIQDAKMFCANS